MGKALYIFILLSVCCNIMPLWGQTSALQGVVLDKQTRQPLDYATIQLFCEKDLAYGGITNGNGRFELSHLQSGTYRVVISYLGYDSLEENVKVDGIVSEVFYLSSSAMSLNEVVVTASESKHATSASVIDRTAMTHIQPAASAIC